MCGISLNNKGTLCCVQFSQEYKYGDKQSSISSIAYTKFFDRENQKTQLLNGYYSISKEANKFFKAYGNKSEKYDLKWRTVFDPYGRYILGYGKTNKKFCVVDADTKQIRASYDAVSNYYHHLFGSVDSQSQVVVAGSHDADTFIVGDLMHNTNVSVSRKTTNGIGNYNINVSGDGKKMIELLSNDRITLYSFDTLFYFWRQATYKQKFALLAFTNQNNSRVLTGPLKDVFETFTPEVQDIFKKHFNLIVDTDDGNNRSFETETKKETKNNSSFLSYYFSLGKKRFSYIQSPVAVTKVVGLIGLVWSTFKLSAWR